MHVVDPPNWLWQKLWTVLAQHTSYFHWVALWLVSLMMYINPYGKPYSSFNCS